MKEKTIYLLIGPKGSGKSYIGTLFDAHFGIPFLRVESWVKELRRGREIKDSSYLQEVFQTIEQGVREQLEHLETVSFESTALTDYFDEMYQRLCRDFRVVVIRIHADPNLCLKRVKTRDQSIHINVSDEDVLSINEQAIQKVIAADFEIDNNRKSKDELLFELKKIITANTVNSNDT